MSIEEYVINEINLKIESKEFINFQKKICMTNRNILGVRVPNLRIIAKKLAKNFSYLLDEKVKYIIDTDDRFSFEEIMIKGFLIEYINELEINDRLKILELYIPCIKDWAICDMVCSTLKFVNKNKEEVIDFLDNYFKSDEEFMQRFAVVISLNYYIDDIYIDKILDYYKQINSKAYYSKMAISWALSKIYIKYPKKALSFLKENVEDDFIYNMAIQKIIDSYKVKAEDKAELRKIKRIKR